MIARLSVLPFMIILLSSSTVFFFSTTHTYAQAEDCDPSYSDVCIRPPPPDLDCSDIPDKDFGVLPPDPHGFDRDGDGIGCET